MRVPDPKTPPNQSAPTGLDRRPVRIIRDASEFDTPDAKVCVAMGMFDGVHLGHQRVLNRTISDARNYGALAAAVTFDQHPSTILAPSKAPALIYPLAQKLDVLASLGIEIVLLIHFDLEFSRLSGEAFVEDLAAKLGRVKSVCVGTGFVFGFKRTGNVPLLRRLGHKLDFEVHDVPPVLDGGRPISSTRIREGIQAGELESAGQLLGRPYSIRAVVNEGERLGRKLGFPTANLAVTGLVLPPVGVYAGHARVNGQRHLAVANIGYRPTLDRPEATPRLEVHLVQFSGDLYGRQVEFEFGKRLRGERKFPSLEALKEQIGRDVTAAIKLPD